MDDDKKVCDHCGDDSCPGCSDEDVDMSADDNDDDDDGDDFE